MRFEFKSWEDLKLKKVSLGEKELNESEYTLEKDKLPLAIVKRLCETLS